MKEKVKCPYCGKGINVDTDDWEAYEVYVLQCKKCSKYSIGYASVSLSYNIKKLDCKNGLAEHKYRDIPISSGHTIRVCKVCGDVESGVEE